MPGGAWDYTLAKFLVKKRDGRLAGAMARHNESGRQCPQCIDGMFESVAGGSLQVESAKNGLNRSSIRFKLPHMRQRVDKAAVTATCADDNPA